jgi:hypothetical protein
MFLGGIPPEDLSFHAPAASALAFGSISPKSDESNAADAAAPAVAAAIASPCKDQSRLLGSAAAPPVKVKVVRPVDRPAR